MNNSNGILVDLKRCTGCDACTLACQQEHALAPGNSFVHVETIGGPGSDEPLGKFPDLHLYWRPLIQKGCNLCQERTKADFETACVENCYTKALTYGDLADPQSVISHKINELTRAGRVIHQAEPFLATRENIFNAY
jgi:Fe-S-cluster-containing dehydrogenase component